MFSCGQLLLSLSKYFPQHKLPENLFATTDAKAALLGADYCLHAVPVQVFCLFGIHHDLFSYVVTVYLLLQAVLLHSHVVNK